MNIKTSLCRTAHSTEHTTHNTHNKSTRNRHQAPATEDRALPRGRSAGALDCAACSHDTELRFFLAYESFCFAWSLAGRRQTMSGGLKASAVAFLGTTMLAACDDDDAVSDVAVFVFEVVVVGIAVLAGGGGALDTFLK